MKIDIPEFLSHLKVDPRGYPVPFFVKILDGVPQWQYQSDQKRYMAVERHLCHICGKKLHKDYFYFISGPHGLKNKTCSDAAMHRDCAEYALRICPHMFFQKMERKTDEAENPVYSAHKKPDNIFLIKSSKFNFKFHPEAKANLIHFNVVAAEEYIYVNNRLQKK